MKYKILSLTLFWLIVGHTSQAQFSLGKLLGKGAGKSGGLSENEIVLGLKEALERGCQQWFRIGIEAGWLF